MVKKADFIDLVGKTAELARLRLTPEQKERYAREIDQILRHFRDINDLEVGEVENFEHIILEKNQVRKDQKKDFCRTGQEIIRNSFPQREKNFLKVREVL